jgi:hypothetical protein
MQPCRPPSTRAQNRPAAGLTRSANSVRRGSIRTGYPTATSRLRARAATGQRSRHPHDRPLPPPRRAGHGPVPRRLRARRGPLTRDGERRLYKKAGYVLVGEEICEQHDVGPDGAPWRHTYDQAVLRKSLGTGSPTLA